MSRTNVLQRPKVSESSDRNGFDLSQFSTFNLSAGMLIPIWWQKYIAGTKVKLSRSVFLRTNAVNTAAFVNMQFHVDYYKVPLRLLWSPWNDFKLRINDLNSSLMVTNPSSGAFDYTFPYNAVPTFDVNKFERYIHYMTTEFGRRSLTDALGFTYANGYLRLKDFFGYGGKMDVDSSSSAQNTSFLVNPMPACAYQKIYFDHYRNSAYENNNPFAYNLDWLKGKNQFDVVDTNVTPRSTDMLSLLEMHRLRYVDYRKDAVFNVYPALNYVSTQPNGYDWSIPSSVQGMLYKPLLQGSNGGSVYVSENAATSPISSRPVSVQNIRAAFALDKLLRATSYAPKHVKQQIEARFGVKYSDKLSNETERIGSTIADIGIQEVVSMADTEQASLGALGGKGVAFGKASDHFETYCDEDCIVMAIAYVLPRSMYDSFGTDEWITKISPEQFFQPELQNLGLEPFYNWEIHRESASDAATNNNIVRGYRPRNSNYKIAKDLNHGLFRLYNVYYHQNGSADDMEFVNNTNSLAAFINHTDASLTTGQNGMSYTDFKVSPRHLNTIFVNEYPFDGSPVNDQFFGWFMQDNPIVSNMSVHGQPRI